MRIIIFLLLLTSCANLPNGYNQNVRITSGKYSGSYGRLIGDCPGLEIYKVRVVGVGDVCIRVWDMIKD